MSIDKGKIAKISSNPGVYIFKDKAGALLYIGKATNLRSRVGSYFRGGEAVRPIEEMIHAVADIQVQATDSVLEALILEANLIQKHQPKYNVLGKDDKSFAYFVITKEEFPRVLILRQTDLPVQQKIIRQTFGPYTSKKQMGIALKIIRKIFPFHALAARTEKGCLDFQLGKCPGPHAGAITKADYAKNIRGIRMILEGKKQSLLKKMEKEMRAFAQRHEFEKAAETRNKVFALKHIHDIALISEEKYPQIENFEPKNIRSEAYDISNISGTHAVGSMVVFKNSEPDKSQYRKFRIKTIAGANDVGAMAEVLFRRFKNDWPVPDLILLDGGQGHVNMAEKILNELSLRIPVVAVAKGKTRKNLNFQFPISKQFSMSKFSNDLKNILQDKNLVKRIMDEAHRFAITYHKKLRKKAFRG